MVRLLDTALWALAVLLYGVGDVLTTLRGARRAGVREANPLVRTVASDAPDARTLVALKLLAFSLFAAGYLAFDRGLRTAIPAAVATLGAVVTALNVRTLRRAR